MMMAKMFRINMWVFGMVMMLCSMSVSAQDCGQVRLAANKIRVMEKNVSYKDNFLVLSMRLNLDSLRLPANSQLVYTPVVAASGDSLRLPELVVNGRRQQIMYQRGVGKRRFSEHATVVRRMNGKPQMVDYLATVPIQSERYKNFDVSLHEDLCGCGDWEAGNDIALLSQREPEVIQPAPQPEVVKPAPQPRKEKAIKIFHLDKRCYIDFPVDQTTLYVDYHHNREQLDSIVNTIHLLKNDPDLEVVSINIHGYASPESPYKHNAFLAKNRAQAIVNYVRRMVNLPDKVFTVSSTPEDWEGLRKFLRESDLAHKEEILVISEDERLTWDAREWKIKTQYPSEYRYMLDHWYPLLRHTDYHIAYKVNKVEEYEVKE